MCVYFIFIIIIIIIIIIIRDVSVFSLTAVAEKAWYKLEESAGGLLDEDFFLLLCKSPVAIGRVYLNRFIIVKIIVTRTYMGVSKNRGTPKWMVYKGKPY